MYSCFRYQRVWNNLKTRSPQFTQFFSFSPLLLSHKYGREIRWSYIYSLILHFILFFCFFSLLLPSFSCSLFVFLFRHVYLVLVLNTQNFTFQICSHDQKCNGILLTVFWFLLEIMQYCCFYFSVGRTVGRSIAFFAIHI